MDGEKADLRVSPEGGLRAVAVMHVPIDDEHVVEPQLAGRGSGPDGDVVEQAKAHCRVFECVVSGRTHQAQGALVFARYHSGDGVGHGSGCTQGHVVRSRVDGRILFDVAAPLPGEGFDR